MVKLAAESLLQNTRPLKKALVLFPWLLQLLLQMSNTSHFEGLKKGISSFSLWGCNPVGTLRNKVICDVHIYSLLHKESQGFGSEGSGQRAVNCTLNEYNCHSSVTENYSRGAQPPHFVNCERSGFCNLSATYISWIGSSEVDRDSPCTRQGESSRKSEHAGDR